MELSAVRFAIPNIIFCRCVSGFLTSCHSRHFVLQIKELSHVCRSTYGKSVIYMLVCMLDRMENSLSLSCKYILRVNIDVYTYLTSVFQLSIFIVASRIVLTLTHTFNNFLIRVQLIPRERFYLLLVSNLTLIITIITRMFWSLVILVEP